MAVDMSRDWHFNLDAISLRVKGRFAAAIPDPNKAIRKLAIERRAGRDRRDGQAPASKT